jgi:hypothetical protein
VQSHLADDTETFDRWFRKVDNLVHQIAKKKSDGGPIDRESVRQALLEIVFQAYVYVGECVHHQMLAFRDSLPRPPSKAERAIFDSMYLRRPYLGDLPMVLLHDRFSMLREVILDIWDNPKESEQHGVLLKLLSYYEEMSRKRREGDRRYKQQHNRRNVGGRSALVIPLNPNTEVTSDSHAELFQRIAAEHRATRRAQCQCPTLDNWVAKVEGQPDDQIVVIQDGCTVCGHWERVSISLTEFKRFGRRGSDKKKK